MIYFKKFPRCARQFAKNLLRKIKAILILLKKEVEAKKSWGHGIEPTTSRLEPGSLTTRSTGSLFDIVGDFGAVPGPWFF